MAEHAGFSLNIWDNDNDFLQGEKDRLMAHKILNIISRTKRYRYL
jgi:hypothetical protein